MLLKYVKKTLCCLTATAFLGLLAAPLQAAMVQTPTLLKTNAAQLSREHLTSLLAREDVQAKLQTLGVTPAQAEKRIGRLTDEEIIALNQHFDSSPAGGDAVGIILIGFLVLVITDLLGVTDVFTFIKPAKK